MSAKTSWRRHGTKFLGLASLIVSSAIAVPELMPDKYDPMLAFVNLVLAGLTVKRGYTNTKTQS